MENVFYVFFYFLLTNFFCTNLHSKHFLNVYPCMKEMTVTSCSLGLDSLQGCHVTTVEGLGDTKTNLHPLQAGMNTLLKRKKQGF